MSTLCNPSKKLSKSQILVTLDEYEPALGAPFKVILHKSVQQIRNDQGDVIETRIPNMAGLLKTVAARRAMCDRKFSPADVKFVRKALCLKGSSLADIIGISAEHMSRCENGDRVLSVSAEKLLRVIAVEARYDTIDFEKSLTSILSDSKNPEDKSEKFKDLILKYRAAVSDLKSAILSLKISTVHSTDDELEFVFSLRESTKDDPDASEAEYEEYSEAA